MQPLIDALPLPYAQYHFPIYGCLRHAYGEPWELYKRLGRMETEVYRFSEAFAAEPSRDQITDGIARDLGRVADPVY